MAYSDQTEAQRKALQALYYYYRKYVIIENGWTLEILSIGTKI